ncbi:MAG: formylglycine-generating enzyme family protein [Candidatus Sericytochromatia bacterium]|nr:formylglycine-generating enzyme family protein [Candidatus Sericytochromatia bacterium]
MPHVPFVPLLLACLLPLGPLAAAAPKPVAATGTEPTLRFVKVTGGIRPDGVQVRPFLLQATEVTQRQWRALLHSEPSAFTACDDCPVESVNWTEAAAFANALSRRDGLPESYILEKCRAYPGTGTTCKIVRLASPDPQSLKGYRLPTEAEWAWAAGAARKPAGPSAKTHPAGWLKANAGNRTHAVGGLPSQPPGVHDLFGNVWEWCHDIAIDPNKQRRGQPEDPARGTYRVVKGGSWATGPEAARPEGREPVHMNYRDPSVGFRLARSL